MTTMGVLDKDGSPVTIEKPLAPGRAAASASRPVALSNEDAAFLDGIEGKLDTLHTDLGTIDGRVDGLETLITATNTKLDTLIADVNANGRAAASASAPVTLSNEDFAVIDGLEGILGTTAGAKVVTDANGTLQQYLRGIVTFLANALGAGTAAASIRAAIPTDQSWPTGMSSRDFQVAFATLTRPANTTPYSAADAISDNATAGSVTALVSGNISDTNDDPLIISEILVVSTDTGLAGKKIRAYLFNSDPTASSGVGGGDNAAYSQKKAGYVGSFMGWMETGFSDGTVGRLVPCFNETNFTQAGGFVVCKPVSGAKTLYIQYQAVEAFTPSANSTTIIGTARGFQGRAS